MWELVIKKTAAKDAANIKRAGLKPKVERLFAVLEQDPFQDPPPFEALIGNLQGAYSRRINRKHRLVYEVHEAEHIVRIIRLWSHYGD